MPESIMRLGQKGRQTSIFYTDYGALFGEEGEGVYYAFISGAMLSVMSELSGRHSNCRDKVQSLG